MNEQTLRNLFCLESENSIESIQIFDEIDSTNSEALRQIRAGNTENRLVLANSQSAGKGRRGRHWLSPKKSGVYLSLSRSFSQPTSALQSLSLVTAISVVEALSVFGANKLQLKWPNDVLFEKKKLAGILLELQQKDNALFVVFGIGVNIELSANAVASIDRAVTDLHSIIIAPPPTVDVVAVILNQLCRNIIDYESNGFSAFEERWNALDCYRMSDIVIENGENRLVGKSLGVDSSGALLIQTENGVQAINAGELFPSLRPLAE
jgi:BirA family transcriptional regulator, biotin operon repressor / biotin---[acetyl-CoA-carboxylase] ligase